jgi:hypothetical protein
MVIPNERATRLGVGWYTLDRHLASSGTFSTRAVLDFAQIIAGATHTSGIACARSLGAKMPDISRVLSRSRAREVLNRALSRVRCQEYSCASRADTTLVIHSGGFNLGLLMRRLIGVGTPRGLQGRLAMIVSMLAALIGSRSTRRRYPSAASIDRGALHSLPHRFELLPVNVSNALLTTGC